MLEIKKKTIIRILNGDMNYLDMDEKLIDDKDVAISAAKVDGIYPFRDVFDSKFTNDYDVMYYAYQKDGISALEYVGNKLKNDYDFMNMAISEDGRALRYASKELQNDRRLIKISECHTKYDDYSFEDDEENDFSGFHIESNSLVKVKKMN